MSKVYIILACVTLLLGCEKENMGDCFKSTGKTVSKERVLPAFSAIELQDRINLTYHYFPEYKAVIKAGKNLQEEIITEVKEGLLTIRNDNRCNWVRSFKKEIDLQLYAPNFEMLTYYGSGEVLCHDTIKSANFILNMWEASGNISLLFKGNYLELKSHTGPGEITCKGKTEELIAYLNGNGRIYAGELEANKALVINQNTGKMFVNCRSEMKAEISGSGNIYYIGNPKIELKDYDSGELIKQ